MDRARDIKGEQITMGKETIVEYDRFDKTKKRIYDFLKKAGTYYTYE